MRNQSKLCRIACRASRGWGLLPRRQKNNSRRAQLAGLLLLAVAAGGQVALGQRSGNPWPMTGAPGINGPLELLTRPEIREELELVSDQVDKLRDLRVAARNRMRQRFVELRSGGPESARSRIPQVAAELRRELDQDLSEILLPHQHARLRQLQLQLRLRGGNVLAFLTDDVVKRLEITAEQQSQLREKGEQLNREYREKLAGLRAEFQQQMMQMLSGQQQEQLKALIGEPFQFTEAPAQQQAE